jgi:hypothetical protein
MKSGLLVVPMLVVALSSAGAQNPGPPTPSPEQVAARNDSLQKDRQMHVDRIREQIKGKEELPAEDVFQNIKILNKMPAGRLLNIMAGGYSNSLGVSCSHCHVTSDFAKEDKPQKQVTRDMVQMAAFINDSLLKKIDGIQSQNPGINCGTCHNGRARPGFGPRGPQKSGQ